MQIINKNPLNTIPDITEHDIDSKIFVVLLTSRETDAEYIAYMVRNTNQTFENIIGCYGGINGKDIGRCIFWFNSPSLIHMLLRIWTITDLTTCYILESRSDLETIRNNIKNIPVMAKLESEVIKKFGGIV